MVELVAAPSRGRGPRSGAGQVFTILRDEIITLALAPGRVLSRQELQERFGYSSTPIRDALMRLEEEGLVEIFPQHATVVSPIDLGRARQGQFLRRSIELEIVRTLAFAPEPGLVARLRSLIRQQKALADVGEHGAFVEADQAFHRATYEAAGVLELWHLVRRQSGHIDRLRRLHLPKAGKITEILEAHTAIVDAIEAGSPDAAQAALRDHLSRSLDFADSLKASHPEYFRG
ncbi:GntR family transcriptional regulator [Prosthecomicrobium hirschii]|uniref:Transcriptional regulator n=1 Tax=Prosthecodimorpha hirschii TaxID=665126 RepID=A0A0P6W4C7_9HYPH|nr:GntR family transcriptional regulator [Prosthecomicrobium hirschii]KPL53307.1 transcriptional regulator [Prosthecomicrobium hirschii]MCW1842359.1 GntR family transcriptional regulator [Prosthecomicrobium hirschii]TPQ49081.1 GntR family transcriptional regulator [Prosthecomicrobium hirschii]